MEFGPVRCEAARSWRIRARRTQKILNLKVKYRESLRPFAPAVRREDIAVWFEIDVDSTYLALVAPVKETRRCTISPAESRLFGIDNLNV